MRDRSNGGIDETGRRQSLASGQPSFRQNRHPFLIGVAGGTASGKTTVCDRIMQRLHDQCVVMLSQDSFYRTLTPEEMVLAKANNYNFDHPDALDRQELLHCLQGLKEGRSVDIPVYDFATHSRSTETRRVDPADVVIMEGILVLAMEEIRGQLNMKIYTDTDDDVRLARRIQRDVASRGRDVASVIEQYTRFVKPAFDQFIGPSRRHADIIVPWQSSENVVAIDLITEHIRLKLRQHDLIRIYRNLEVMPSNFQMRGMHTILRDRETSNSDFVFYADRINRLLVEAGLGHLPFTEKIVTTPTGHKYVGVEFARGLCGVSVIRSGEAMEAALRECCQGIKIGKILVHRHGKSEDIIYEKLPSDISRRYVLLLDPVLGTGNTACKAIQVLLDKGVEESKILFLCIIAAPPGIHRVCQTYPSVKVITSEIDSGIDENCGSASSTSRQRTSVSSLGFEDDKFSWQEFFNSDLPKKLGGLVALLLLSRVGVYIRLPGVDVDAFADSLTNSGLMGYIDTLSGGSISKVGLFSLGIIPYINASIVLQLFSAAFPTLKKLQRDEGAAGRAKFQYYQKLLAFAFAIVQAVGQLFYIRPFVDDFTPGWLAGSSCALVAGALALVYIADTISELKLGNGTSVLIFANIASALPASIGQLVAQNDSNDPTNVAVFFVAFALTTLGIIYVQEAERRIPVNYSNRYSSGNLARQSYLPFKVNATGVMPLIFASSLLALPAALARYTDSAALDDFSRTIGPGGPLYVPFNVALIVFFNYYYTFLQLEPKDLAEQLKKGGAAIPAIRPGRQTAEYVTRTLTRMSLLGSVFLGALSAAPALVEGITHLTAFRGFAGTSVLIMVGVATDTARRIRAEQAMAKYQDVDKLYDNLKL
ncbi:hypothetical protein GPECTOR_2g1229 [Gonium pectorale]|uniref:Uridine kinase n=1 Tax=Gonium pectorale TaxID=33097 RepID=A0A150H0M9_GONPE|nr:hypothetical protein GPECTOR_2g1229 [Gonium pectorale]|eukprot:KXZ55679.1 hypothetical protein GPECTOR_2g1229 [Gonium pectorale]